MRILMAFTIFVSLNAFAFAETDKTGTDKAATDKTEWATVHDAGVAAFDSEKYSDAARYFEESWPAAVTPWQRGVSANDIGQAYRGLGRSKQAIPWFERAREIWRADPLAGHNQAVVAAGLSEAYRNIGDYQSAEAMLREALAADRNQTPSSDMIRNALADLLREEGRFQDAEPLFQESLRSEHLAWGERASALTGLADIDRQRGAWESSVEKWNQVLDLARAHDNEIAQAIASRGLAETWLAAGNMARAEPLFRRALSIMETNPAATPDQLANALSGIGGFYRAQNKLALAEEAWARALELDRKVFGEVHPQVALAMEMLAEIHAVRGEREIARDYANRAVEQMRQMFGDDSMPAAVGLANRAIVERRIRDSGDANADYSRALQITREHPGYDLKLSATIQHMFSASRP